MELFTASHLVFLSIIFLVWGSVIIVPCWKILEKAGFTPLLSVLAVVPVMNLILLYVVAFSDWKRNGDPVSDTLPIRSGLV
ncbi:MAG: hypothetical protein M3O31_11865 [Acidobacteriota bacterium]|nr:hypothetical protein [Acidobacteriota bacterium]